MQTEVKIVETAVGDYCFQRAVELIGRRWTGAILVALLEGVDRYSQIRSAVPGLSDRMLCVRLRELENEDIVRRRVLQEVPVLVHYELTPKGRGLGTVIDAVQNWARDWGEPSA